ncbi:phosphoribosylformylglycinamidine synthase subunit PurS [Thermosynechococcus sp. NK55a]|jgi:phosphoribosylformylglycinamidine synthase|uniref:phosphoribosylformylglycinamidine synthase subunit PurS n=1 Tax=unclassified Thermosynechococcus TaxID=2622553 RepID=UPI0003D7E05A|nr:MULTISPECIES: phosphoribosylformylglycinamidine synthase subunit PurS [unclassified Thermosynechococcus]AHB88803.1 phosphoribosylformylglycinamidine synthase subunit PurS [Thermosynechococcus sp. NK55a]RMH66275.1 MAG: phosphoribosylformylglycinamidine synthase subunit PurS [Cyanobacteria bacterium J003]HIK24050.1 phosphoribosylformylglycinamidine synthase subunit PurS [Thermosynechococcus sp. M3746_W2019_013]
MAQFRAQVFVTLRPSVLDPAGVAVQAGIHHLGYTNVQSVRIGKLVELTLEARDRATAEVQLTHIADQLLANPVIETFRIELQELATAAE